MNTQNIYIKGLIGTIYNPNGEVKERGVELIDVIQQVQQAPFADTFDFYIKSEGGVFETGFEIFYYMESLKKLGKQVNTIGVGQVASIATVPFMAGTTRRLEPNTDFLIHLPMIGLEGYLNTSALEKAKTDLEPYEKKLINFYKETTGLSEEAISPLVKKETILSNEQAFDLKFTTQQEIVISDDEINQIFNPLPINKVVAYTHKKVNTNKLDMTENDKKWFEDLFKPITNLFEKKNTDSKKGFKVVALAKAEEIVNITETDANGTIIEFPHVAEGTMPVEGDMAMIDGKPAEGEYLMPNGTTYVFVAGDLTQIVEVEEMVDVEAIKAENEQLKTQLAEQTTAMETQAETFKTEILNIKKAVTSRFDKDEKKDPPKKDDNDKPTVTNTAKERLEKLKELKNKK